MSKAIPLIFFLAFIKCNSVAQIINREPLSPRITGYSINATLDTEAKIVRASMKSFWVNISGVQISEVRLHMYMNAFRSSRTTFFREENSTPGSKESEIGWIRISSMTDGNGSDLTGCMEFISPDDGNINDSTVLRVDLPVPLRPGDTLFLNTCFETKLPDFSYEFSRGIKRSGFKDDFFFVGQWFPKFGVYETPGMRYSVTGGWNCHQFHANSEFYSNHSVYNVKVTVPGNYVVGSGGMLLSETPENGLKTLEFRAEDIVDFAWTAWPGYAEFTDQWNHVKITFLLPKERIEQVPRQCAAIKNALEYLSKNAGPFPWPHLTFIDPPAGTGHAGGMEYTTLFTSWSSYYVPGAIHFPEMVTVHEFGHAYFMGIMASNEFEEPWMDEGINSFWEGRIMDHYWGDNSGMLDHPLLKVSDKTVLRSGYVRSDNRQIISNNELSWNYPRGTYGMMSYQKTATWLFTLMGIIGEETTNNIFREYYKRWAFRHPSGKDFIAVVNDVVKREHGDKFGPDMNWFFDQVLYGTGICDYKVNGFRNFREESQQGSDSSSMTAGAEYKSVAMLERVGEVILPVDVLVHFDNGEEVREKWDGKERFKNFTYSGRKAIDWVKIDPEYKLLMDVNFINNSMTSAPDRIPVRRFRNKLVLILEFFISTITL